MKMLKKSLLLLSAAAISMSLCSCSGDTGTGTETAEKDYSGMEFVVGAYRDLRTDPYNNSYSIGADEFMAQYPGSNVNFVIHKNNEELVTAIASGDVWDVQMSIMSPRPSLFKQEIFEDITDYVDLDNPIYTKELIENTCVMGGRVYGLSNVMMSDIIYAIYNEDMFLDYGIKTPYEYYQEGAWTWDNFITMVDSLKKNDLGVAITWSKPYLNRRYGLVWNDDYTVSSIYDGQEQREWLNFVRTLVYDKGIKNAGNASSTNGVAKRENAIRVEMLPHIMVAAVGNSPVDTIRYIPWATKDGQMDSVYCVDYHFCVPSGAKSIDGSVELMNYMIEACTEDRIKMYQENMLPEDWEIFQQQMENFYTITWIDGYGYDEVTLINEFSQGKAVSQHISEVNDMLLTAVDNHNAEVASRNGNLVGGAVPAATEAPAEEAVAAE